MIDTIKTHINSLKSGRWNWDRIKRGYVIFVQREGRGAGFLAQVWDYGTKGMMIGVFCSTVLHIELPVIAYVWGGFGYLFAMYLIGYYDETKAKLWQTQVDMDMKRVNPFNQRIEEKLDNIERMVKHGKGG